MFMTGLRQVQRSEVLLHWPQEAVAATDCDEAI
jgi:hypothetical protein